MGPAMAVEARRIVARNVVEKCILMIVCWADGRWLLKSVPKEIRRYRDKENKEIIGKMLILFVFVFCVMMRKERIHEGGQASLYRQRGCIQSPQDGV